MLKVGNPEIDRWRSLTLRFESLEHLWKYADAPHPCDALGVELRHWIPDYPLLLHLVGRRRRRVVFLRLMNIHLPLKNSPRCD